MQKQKGERKLFRVGFYTFYNLSSFLANKLRPHLVCCKDHSPTDYQPVKGQVVRALPEHISVRFSGTNKLDLVLKG